MRPRLTPIAADGLMLVAALLWGSGFIAQRLGAEHLQAFTFTGLRFSVGAIALLPFVLGRRFDRPTLIAGAITGSIMAVSAVFQQWGVGHTTAGNAGFITSLYVIFVPIIGLFTGHRARRMIWLAVGLAVLGLWFLSVDQTFSVNRGDPIVLVCAIGWAVHLVAVGRYSSSVDALPYAFLQFLITGATATLCGVAFERPDLASVDAAKWAILYGGLFPVCVAFTLQMVAQRVAPPAHAAVLLSLEAVFAMAFGAIFLSEEVTQRKSLGAALMFAGMLAAQLRPLRDRPPQERADRARGQGGNQGQERPEQM